MTDFQRTKLYRAETVLDKNPMRFKDLRTCQGFVEATLWHPDILAAFPLVVKRGIHVKNSRAKAYSVCTVPDRGSAVIETPSSGAMYTDRVMVHEMCHAFTWERIPGDPGHGAGFAGVYLWVVGIMLGRAKQIALQTSFVEQGVRIRRFDG